MHKKQIAFIESNTTGTGLLFLEKALKMDFEVIYLTNDPTRYPFLSDLNIIIIQTDTLNKNSILNSLKKYLNLVGILSTSEYYIEIAASIAEILQLPGNRVSAILECRNKRIFYENLKKTPFFFPKTWSAKNLEAITKQQEEFIYPLVVKPISGSGSVGVKKCHTFEQLCKHSTHLFSLNSNERGHKTEDGVLIQQYIEGPEFSAEIIAYNGDYYPIGITAKHTTSNDYFIETGHDFPANLSLEIQAQIWQTLKEVLKFFHFQFGPAHIEFKLQGVDLILIEVNPRLAGGMIPQLICYACQIDVYEMILNLYTNEKVVFQALKYEGASIRFFVAKENGKVIDLVDENKLKQCKNVIEVHFAKSKNDQININNDYRDRFGYLITKAPNSSLSSQFADQAMEHFYLKMQTQTHLQGRLLGEPHPVIKKILRNPKNKNKWLEEVQRISYIDLAHILMLYKTGIIGVTQSLPLILEIQNFQKQFSTDSSDLDFSRGAYYAYENHLKEKLGIELSGNNHIGRSRNDINAALFYLLCRDSFLKVYKKTLELSKILLEKALVSTDIPLPIYSQHQPAAPSNYAFYLLAINEPIKRVLEDLKSIEVYLNTSPLGAGAGCGTDIAIDPEYVGKLLGFKKVFCNALDAIANRDFILRYEGILANLCMTMSRIAQDYQLWTTQEFHFFELPDTLCSSSSMMPQKKNPYILEVIKCKTMDLITNLIGIYAKMHKVPVGNSIEVSSAAYDNIDVTTRDCLDTIDLLSLVISQAEPISKNMLTANRIGLTVATYVTNQIMKQESISFREAHLKVGRIIREAQENNEDTFAKLTSYLNLSLKLEDRELIYSIVQDLKFGGGPAFSSISRQIEASLQNYADFSEWIKNEEFNWNQSFKFLNDEIGVFIEKFTLI